MSALWNALDEIDDFYRPVSIPGDDDDLVDVPAAVAIPRPAAVARPANPDALTDAPSNVYLTDKARAALHPCPIRAHERQMALVANGDPAALAIAAACARWQQQHAAASEVK